jgi:hypothetical protein
MSASEFVSAILRRQTGDKPETCLLSPRPVGAETETTGGQGTNTKPTATSLSPLLCVSGHPKALNAQDGILERLRGIYSAFIIHGNPPEGGGTQAAGAVSLRVLERRQKSICPP